MDFLANITNWPFLNEPLYRWGIFFGALIFISFGWASILSFMH